MDEKKKEWGKLSLHWNQIILAIGKIWVGKFFPLYFSMLRKKEMVGTYKQV